MAEYPYPLHVEGDWTSINPKTLQSKLHIYFQSKKKSQGGDCTVICSEKSCTVLFRSQEIRDQVLAKAEHSVTIEEKVVKLQVSVSHSEEKPPECTKPGSDGSTGALHKADLDASETATSEVLEATPVSSAVVLENVPEASMKEYLMLLVGTICNLSEDEYHLELIPESDVAVVTFNDSSDVEKFLTGSMTQKKFQELGLKARHLEQCQSVKVENLPANCTKDYLELYFEKNVEKVKRSQALTDEQAAIITFDNPQAVQKVLGKKYKIFSTPVDIYPYYASLCSALYGKDRPTYTLPKPFTDKIHPAIREFLQKKGLMSSIVNQMNSRFCQVSMDKTEVLFSPLPALLKQKGLTKQHIDIWQKDIMDAFKNILSNYGVFEHAVIHSVWTEVEKDIRSVVKDKAVLEMNFSTGYLTLAGMAKDINVLKPILENFLNEASSKMEREKNKISESISMSPVIFLLFQEEGLEQQALTKYPQLELTYRKDTSQLMVTGILMEMLDIKNVIIERQINRKEKDLKMDPLLLEFLGSVDSEEMSRDLFLSKGISAVCTPENEIIALTASTDKALTEAEKRLESMLTLQSLSLEDVRVLAKPEWQDLINQLYDTYNLSKKKTVLIKPSENRVVICGFQEPVREVSKSLEQFIHTYSRIEETVRVKCYAVVKFIKEKMTHFWEKFLKGDELNIKFDPRRPLIRVCGERIHVQPALKSLQNMANDLHTEHLTIQKAGAKKSFQEQSSLVLMMMKDQRFIVVLEDESMKEDVEESYDEGREEQHFCEVHTPAGIVIKAMQADICQFKVDAVVNAANEDLKHIGGLALALLNAAGPTLQKRSDQYVSKNGKVRPGSAVTTEAGLLPCKYVVHAVGPRYYNTDKSTSVKLLRQAVRESLNQAVSKRCTSIAIPVISSGIFGFPVDLCTETIAQELHAYVENQNWQGGMNTVKEIYLVDNNFKSANAMAQALKNEFRDFNPRMNFGQQMGHGHSGHANRGEENHERGSLRQQGTGARGNNTQLHRARGFEDFERQRVPDSNAHHRTQFGDWDRPSLEFLAAQSTKEGLKITLWKGNIQDTHSDVIVNTSSDDLDLSKGAISKALLSAAGPQLQAETRSHLRALGTSCVKYGDIVATKGYNLNCQMVFHTACPFWSGGRSSEDELLKEIIQNCLRKAENQRMASISFPAIGTGNLGFPRNLVSRILLSEIHSFSARMSPQSLNEVMVIVHPSDSETIQWFVKSFRGDGQGLIMKGAPDVQLSLAKKSPVRSPQSPARFRGAVSTPSTGVHKMQIGHLTLEVSSGDITKETCDAIINSTNYTFSLKSGVSRAILDAAGSVVEMECARIVASKNQPEDMIMTSGGALPCRNIIHVHIRQNSPEEIKKVVYSVLKFCEEQKISSVAFPALGTGQGGVDPSAVADSMIEAVIEFVKKKKGMNLQSVKFLMFQASMVPKFYQSMLSILKQEPVEDEGGVKGWFKGTFEAVTNFFSGGGNAEASAKEQFVLIAEEFEPIVFQLCAETQENLSQAKDLITSITMKDHMSTKIVDSAITCFSQEEADVLRKLQRELTVSIHMSTTGPEPAFTLEGLTRDVMQAESQIRDMIRKVEKNLNRQRDAYMLKTHVEWQYQDRKRGFVSFDILSNYDLEQAFQMRQHSVGVIINNDQCEAFEPYLYAKGKYGKFELKRTDLKSKT